MKFSKKNLIFGTTNIFATWPISQIIGRIDLGKLNFYQTKFVKYSIMQTLCIQWKMFKLEMYGIFVQPVVWLKLKDITKITSHRFRYQSWKSLLSISQIHNNLTQLLQCNAIYAIGKDGIRKLRRRRPEITSPTLQKRTNGSRKKWIFYGKADRKGGGSAPSALTISKCETF